MGNRNMKTKGELIAEKDNLLSKYQELQKIIDNYDNKNLEEIYGDKYSCKYCRFSAVKGLSDDGWHNLCGADNCMCCHSRCERFKPDNTITSFIKNSKLTHISCDDYDCLDSLVTDIFKVTDEKENNRVISILKLIYNINE